MDDTFATLAVAATLSIAVAALARQRGWGIALPLIVVGAVIGALPIGPSAPPDPEIVLLIVLAPLVFGEALGSSFLDLRKVSRPILALAIGLVVATTLVVGGVAVALVAMPLAMAFALGAVLAPTDAVAVSTVARRAGLPRRLVSILEGESLVNDGTGLTALKVALIAAAAGSVTLLEVSGIFVVAVVAGVLVGAAGGWALSWVLRRSNDLVSANALIIAAPFLIYVIAEELQGSGILAVVVAALLIAHSQHSAPGHTGRLQSAVVWRHLTFILQAVAFFLVGLELPDLLGRLDDGTRLRVLLLVLVITLTLIATRGLFVLGMVGVTTAARRSVPGPRLRNAFIIAWAGARGPVSGLAAFSIPLAFDSGEPVPFRDLILATTFGVIVVTLLLSLTLAPLARALRIPSDDDDALVRRIDVMLARAAVDRLSDLEVEAEEAGAPLSPAVVARLREDAERRIDRASEASADGAGSSSSPQAEVDQAAEAASAMVRAEQEELLRMRDEEGLPDAIVRPLLRQLDAREQAFRSPGR
jgi:CPA1 family monovalent cation:H+ antiporter